MSQQQQSSAFGGGAPTERAVEEFGAQIEKSKQSPYMLLNPTFVTVNGDPNSLNSRLATKAANSSKFPIRGFPSDPYDTMYSLKDDLSRPIRIDVNGVAVEIPAMANERRPLPWTEQDISYLKRKRDAEENLAYLTWQADKYDLTDPATRDWFEKRCPSYFAQRESLIEQQIDLASRYAKIRLRGAKTEDDLKLEYLIETDRISLPKGAIWDPYAWVSQEAGVLGTDPVNEQSRKILEYNQRAYRKGLFNPTKVTIPQDSGNMQNPYNKGDISGFPMTHHIGVKGVPLSMDKNFLVAYGPHGEDRSILGARTFANARNADRRANVRINASLTALQNSTVGRTGIGFAGRLNQIGQYHNVASNDVYGPKWNPNI